jgi:hypothetical protein
MPEPLLNALADLGHPELPGFVAKYLSDRSPNVTSGWTSNPSRRSGPIDAIAPSLYV